LEANGYRVLRFWNNDVLGNIEGVLEQVQRALTATPTPNPSPQGGGEQPAARTLPKASSASAGAGINLSNQPFCAQFEITALRADNHLRGSGREPRADALHCPHG
jgi:hypothetical protein